MSEPHDNDGGGGPGEDDGEARARARVPTRVRAAFLRAYVFELARDGLLERVAAALPEYSCALVRDPPAGTAWVASTVIEDIDAAVEALRGTNVLRDYSRRATRAGIVPLTLPAMRAVFDLFGVAPSVLYRRIALFAQVGSRGIEYGWTPAGPRGGVIEVRYTGRPDVPWRTFVGMAGMFELVGELTSTTCTVAAPVRVPDARDTVARFAVAW